MIPDIKPRKALKCTRQKPEKHAHKEVTSHAFYFASFAYPSSILPSPSHSSLLLSSLTENKCSHELTYTVHSHTYTHLRLSSHTSFREHEELLAWDRAQVENTVTRSDGDLLHVCVPMCTYVRLCMHTGLRMCGDRYTR
jgi:hypothetical protein